MRPGLRLILSIVALLGVYVVGTIGYLVIEVDRHPSVLDAAYMTGITLATVAYREVWDLSDHGRMWTLGVITFGIATVSVAFTSLIALFVSGEFRSLREKKKMDTAFERIRDHIILCGYGRMGSLIANDLRQRAVPFVVVDIKPDNAERLRESGVPFLIADATEEETLLRAGLMRAQALVTAVPNDADNVYMTLTAHTMRPELTIIARAEQPTTEAKLRRAGATRVICPQVIGANFVVNVLTRPNVVDFFEIANRGVDLEMDEYVVGAESPLAGRSLRESMLREQTGAMVVAIKHADGKTLFNPDAGAVVTAGDMLILVGPAGVSSRLDAIGS